MPRTFFEKLVFGLMMALAMIYGMEVYNAILRCGGLSTSVFFIQPWELGVLLVVVMVLQNLIGGPLARFLTFKLLTPHKHPPIAITVVLSSFTVLFMCPMMSLVATLLFKGMNGNVFLKWLKTFGYNFPMAYCWQLLIAGPLVRFVFRKMFQQGDPQS
jgi:hypothetical protein